MLKELLKTTSRTFANLSLPATGEAKVNRNNPESQNRRNLLVTRGILFSNRNKKRLLLSPNLRLALKEKASGIAHV